MKPLIVGSLPITDVSDLRQVPSGECDLTELRLDYLHELNTNILEGLVAVKDRIILTVRDENEGGVRHIDRKIKTGFLQSAVEMGFLIDVETEFLCENYVDYTGMIVSRHFLEEEPDYETLENIAGIYTHRARFVKIVTPASMVSSRNLIKLLGKYDNVAVMELGSDPMTRILYSVLGSRLIYCYITEPTAKGQLKCSEVKEFFELIWR